MKGRRWLMGAWMLVVLGLPLSLCAATLTEAQYQQLNTDITITNQAEFAQHVTDRNDQAIADAYNLNASPAFWVWKTSLSEKAIYEETSPTGSVWNWTTYIGQSVQERDAWARMFNPGVINPSLPQVRDAYNRIFGGTGASQTQRDHLTAMSRRLAQRDEALFANTGGGAGTTAAPATLTYEGRLTARDVGHALRGVPLP
jgi:hypothetical protein